MINDQIAALVTHRLPGAILTVDDESALHAGHAGAASGGGHFRLTVVASQFTGLSRLARHRLVYDALADLMRGRIHALAIIAQTPEEARSSTTRAAR
jgi:BolA protein